MTCHRRSVRRIRTATLVAALAVTAPALAQDEEPAAEAAPDDDAYEGVVPGETEGRPPGAPWRSKRWAPVFWIGFQPQEDGASRVFVQLGREVEPEQWIDAEAGQLVVFLPRARLANANAARPLVTRFFDSALAQVEARRVTRRRARGDRPAHPAGVEIRISFVDPADRGKAAARVTREEDGFAYLYLDFGPSAASQP